MGSRGRHSAASLSVVLPQFESSVVAIQAATQEPPAHLSEESATWWRSVLSDYSLEPHHLRLLQAAAEAWDRMQAARGDLAAHGSLTFADSNGNLKAHPCVAIERDARVAFARLIRELDLDADPPSERSRPPALRRNGG